MADPGPGQPPRPGPEEIIVSVPLPGSCAVHWNTTHCGTTPPGGHLEVATGIRDSRAVLSVASTGPAVPDDAVDRILQPFQRLGAERQSCRRLRPGAVHRPGG